MSWGDGGQDRRGSHPVCLTPSYCPLVVIPTLQKLRNVVTSLFPPPIEFSPLPIPGPGPCSLYPPPQQRLVKIHKAFSTNEKTDVYNAVDTRIPDYITTITSVD